MKSAATFLFSFFKKISCFCFLFHVHVFFLHAHLYARGWPEEGLDSLELWMGMNYHVGAGN